MLNKCFAAIAILMANSALASAQDIFWSFSPTELVTTSDFDAYNSETGSAYIFSDQMFGFDAIDLEFTTTDLGVVRFTGGEAFNPTYNIIGGRRFDASEITFDADGSLGGLFSVSVTQNGVNPAILSFFDPGFVAGVGPNGAVLLARVDFEVAEEGTADFEFSLGSQGALGLPSNILNPSFGSATVTRSGLGPLTPYCPVDDPDEFCLPEPYYALGDVNLSGDPFYYFPGSVDVFDIAPFIAVLASGGYQREADCNQDGVVNFFDIAPFLEILNSN